jgi:hypothetical protein
MELENRYIKRLDNLWVQIVVQIVAVIQSCAVIRVVTIQIDVIQITVFSSRPEGFTSSPTAVTTILRYCC